MSIDEPRPLRRLLVPVLVDRLGATWALGPVDVTLAFQSRAVVAESPPPGLPAELGRSLREVARGVAQSHGQGAATVAFAVEPRTGTFRLMGTGPGLPAERAPLESLTGLNLAALERHLARGGLLDGAPPEPRGHALQVRLSARDPERGLAPSPGTLETLRLPAGPGLRADAALEEGETTPADLEIACVTAVDRGRSEALARLRDGLARTVALLAGGATDKAFLSELLDRPEIEDGTADAPWLERLVASGEHLPRRGAEAALLEAAIATREEELARARARFYASAGRGRPEVPDEVGGAVELAYRGEAHRFRVALLGPRLYRVETGGLRLEVRAGPAGRAGRALSCGDRSWRVFSTPRDGSLLVEVDGVPHRIERIERGDLPPATRVRFEALAAGQEEAPPAAAEEVRRLVLGYDYDPAAVDRLVAGRVPAAERDRPTDEILRAFADIGSLFRRQPGGDLEDDGRHSAEEYLFTYLRDLDASGRGLPEAFLDRLRRALAHYGLTALERSPELEESLFRVAIARSRSARQVPPVLALLERLLEGDGRDARDADGGEGFRELLDRIIAETQRREPAVHDLAREVRYRRFDRPLLVAEQERARATAEADLERLAQGPLPAERAERIRALVEHPLPLHHRLSQRFAEAGPELREATLEVMVRRYYRFREIGEVRIAGVAGQSFAATDYDFQGERLRLLAAHVDGERLAAATGALRGLVEEAMLAGREVVVDVYAWRDTPADDEAMAAEIAGIIEQAEAPAGLQRVAVALTSPAGVQHFTFRRGSAGAGGALTEEVVYRGIHPMMALRLELWRLSRFRLERLPAPEGVFLFRGTAHENPGDERLFAVAEVRVLTPVRDAAGRVVKLPQLEHTLMEALAGIRRVQARRPAGERLQWNRVLLNLWPPIDLATEELHGLIHRLAPLAEGLGLEKVAIRCRIPDRDGGEPRPRVLEISTSGERQLALRVRRPSDAPLKPLREYAQRVIELRRRGLVHPYEIVKLLAPAEPAAEGLPAGDFVEHDLDADGLLVPVRRPYGQNTANVVVGVVRSFTGRYPEGMARVILLGDPGRGVGGMGSLAEPECRRILGALELAQGLGVPLEWFALSAGAALSMESGTESMDWIARVLRRLVELTQAGLEVNVVVAGLNAGAQAAWNAVATMLMHTRGILVMTSEGAMVLAGKQELDASGDVSAEDDVGIGGSERIMGPNGQAQYAARDLGEACRILLRWYEHTYRAPGERFPRPAATDDPRDRDVRDAPHGGAFRTVGEALSPADDRREPGDPGHRPPFEIRRVMAAVIDSDHPPLERWYGMRDAEVGVVWDAHLGGHPVCLLGFESRPLPRLGWVPADGPDRWGGGTLSPLATKKVARAVNSASGNRPLVVLAGLSGFDGSPESMRRWQLEHAAELGRAVVNFRGPIVCCVVSSFHGGAFAVFSAALHDNLRLAALEGTSIAVLGGAPAAAVAFAREVDERTRRDPRVIALEQALADPERTDRPALRARLAETWAAVRSGKLDEVAAELDRVHSVERAQRVGSIHDILPPERLRPYLIESVERGMEKEERKERERPGRRPPRRSDA